jgi:hypothetical protein
MGASSAAIALSARILNLQPIVMRILNLFHGILALVDLALVR